MAPDDDPDAGLVGVQTRLDQLTDDHETLLGYAPTSTTNQGVYFLVLRRWPHPDTEDATTISLRYAYLTKGDGSDGWTDGGMNMRVEGDPDEFLDNLARLIYSPANNLGRAPHRRDMRPQADRED